MAGKALFVLLPVMLLVTTGMAAKSSGPKRSHGACPLFCKDYCQKFHSKRACFRSCVPCCDAFDCVPGLLEECEKWTEVTYRGQNVKCPSL